MASCQTNCCPLLCSYFAYFMLTSSAYSLVLRNLPWVLLFMYYRMLLACVICICAAKLYELLTSLIVFLHAFLTYFFDFFHASWRFGGTAATFPRSSVLRVVYGEPHGCYVLDNLF